MSERFTGSKNEIGKALFLYGLKAKEIRPIKSGMINSSFLVRTEKNGWVVVRIYQRGNRSDKEILKEFAVTEKFRRAGVPIPNIFKNTSGNTLTRFFDSRGGEWRVMVMEFVEGRHLKPNDHQLIEEFACLQSMMHKAAMSIEPPAGKPSFKKMTDWLKSERIMALSKLKDKALKEAYEKISDEILFSLEKESKKILSLPSGYVHLDYDSNNLIVSKRKILGVLDFDDMTLQPFVLDSAFSLWWWLFFNPSTSYSSLMKHYKYGYERNRKISLREKETFPAFVRLRNATLAALLFVNAPSKPDLVSFKKALHFDGILKKVSL